MVNIESGMPEVKAARVRLEQALRTARARRVTAVKIIHGYGSTGRGGAIKRDAHGLLGRMLAAGDIKAFAPGEEFSPFYAPARKILDSCPELKKDRDCANGNHGITIVLL